MAPYSDRGFFRSRGNRRSQGKKEHRSKQDVRATIEARRPPWHEIENRRFYSGIMPSVRAPALPMQVFGFPANGKRTCEREIDRVHFGSLHVPRKFATDTWGHRIARPLDPRKVPGVTRYAAASTQRRDSRPRSRTPSI